jgi:hypothetical protein
MTQFRWIPWFLANVRDLTDFNNRLNWEQDTPMGGGKIPASSPPGPGDTALFQGGETSPLLSAGCFRTDSEHPQGLIAEVFDALV